jgi:hypothetical protein
VTTIDWFAVRGALYSLSTKTEGHTVEKRVRQDEASNDHSYYSWTEDPACVSTREASTEARSATLLDASLQTLPCLPRILSHDEALNLAHKAHLVDKLVNDCDGNFGRARLAYFAETNGIRKAYFT